MSTTLLPPVTNPVRAAVARLTAVVDELVDAELWTLGEADLLDFRVAVEAETARLTSVRFAGTREIDGRGAAVSAGATSTVAWLIHRLRQAPGEAAREVRLSGQVTAESLPAAHAALAAGEISPAAAGVIADTDRAIARHATVQERADADATLTGFARELPLTQLRRAATRLQQLLDPNQGDRLGKDEDEQHRARSLRLRYNSDGTLTLAGLLDKEAAATLKAAIDPLAKPKPTGADDAGQPVRDPRSADQRNADALIELVNMATGDDEDHRGQPAQVVVTIGLDDLRTERPTRPGTLDFDIPLSVAAVRRLACDAQVIPAVLGTAGQVLDLGRGTRVVSTPLRRALALRDQGCAFPGCDRPVRWTQAHHIEHWSKGGPTDLHNLVLLCGHHHRAVHHDGWDVQVDPADRLPTFTPPRWIDPDQRPRRRARLRT